MKGEVAQLAGFSGLMKDYLPPEDTITASLKFESGGITQIPNII
jgi:hypothetical protein